MEPDLPVHGVGERKPSVATLEAMFDQAVAAVPDVAALRYCETAVTYAEEARAVTALAYRLASLVNPGDVVALLLPNGIEFQVAYFAMLKALAVPALLNAAYPAPQLEPLLREAPPRLVVCAPETRDAVAALAQTIGIPRVLCFGQDVTLPGLIAAPVRELRRGTASPSDDAALLFSGGTTGIPKAVVHTHARLVAATRCMEYCWPTRSRGEVFLSIAPFTHIYGFLQGVLMPLSSRSTNIIADRFHPETIVDLLARHCVTFFGGGPPAIYAGLLAASNLARSDLSALRVCPSGGAPFPRELMQRWRDTTGLEVHEGYGMTEMAPISSATDLSGVRPGSVGRAIPCNEVQVVDLDTGSRVLPAGERGQVRVRGPHMMAGYRNRPEATAQTIRAGFIHTGDVGHLDEDGFLFITDRLKDVVFVKGFNVFPREIEEVIHTCPKVAAVGVVGMPDERTAGERVVAFVVPCEGETLLVSDVEQYCASRLVGYKRPAEVRVVEKLPMTGAQKLDRIALRSAAHAAAE